MDAEVLSETWLILKEYIKDKQQAADHLMNHLIDLGIDDEDIQELTASDSYLLKAAEYAGVEEEEYLDDDEGW